MATENSLGKQKPQPRVLILSQRKFFRRDLFRCPLYEFEDIIREIDSADILAPTGNVAGVRHSLARRVAFHAPVALNPGIEPTALDGEFDLLVAICGAPGDLLIIESIPDWKDRCKKSICIVDELWVKQIPDHRHFLRTLARFDVLMLYYSQTVGPLSERLGQECRFLPPGVDAITFCPYPNPPNRVIDVYSFGRRSEVTHRKLLEMAENGNMLYLYDTIAGNQTNDWKQHRSLLASLAKRSRYLITNPGLVDRPDLRGDQMEIGNRYFEGAASGSIMIGERPKNEQFDKLFNWSDAVVELPYNSTDVDSIIAELDSSPERQDRIRRKNVEEALMRHDWVYRWEAMLEAVGMVPLPAAFERKKQLAALAELARTKA